MPGRCSLCPVVGEGSRQDHRQSMRTRRPPLQRITCRSYLEHRGRSRVPATRARAFASCHCCSRLWTGQRQGDLLRLTWSAYDGTHIRLRQSKTGARVADSGRCTAQGRARCCGQAKRSPIILPTRTASRGRRTASAHRGARPDKAGIVGVTFNDLRGTAVTRLATCRMHRAEIADHHRTLLARCALDPRCALSAPRSGTCRERDPQLEWLRNDAGTKTKRTLQNDLQNGLASPTEKEGKAKRNQLAGELGFEPRFSESESDVLPLNYSPPKQLIYQPLCWRFCKSVATFCKSTGRPR